MQTLTLKGGVSSARPATPSGLYVLDDSARPVAPRPVRARRAPEVMTHDRAIMRDLVLGAFLGPQFFREDEPARAAEYTTDKTRDAFPARLAADLAAVPTEGGPDGRLPKEYVTSLARGTTRVIASETRKKKASAVPLGPLAFQDAHIVRAVGQLQPGHQAWLRYAYADSKAWDDESGAVVGVWGIYEPRLGKLQAKSLQKAKGLAHLAVQDMKLFVNCARSNYSAGRLCELLGVTDVNYRKHWSARWQGLRDAVLELDSQALEELVRLLKGYDFVLLDRGL
ncbi:hypothetical protein GIW56_22975 [Pseudomonas gessardii]|uniref:Uncharacterized protein n=1 Tax=Pseudomonas gessardii TaxID=78544 RepID=A0ABS9FBL8_9PSED|nr:bacteriophage antitermination protein Q [Pseudomonas gessardii]MCF4981999.1 hypothetical protein [Pseudomonas gessardii]MCF4988453.1 hypothetical protein [Pseudomonas gessardii]MCF5097867.1 hypothetical protein [Pseudomonas gessardii]MCF5109697.1 hypothetical protein [Pseudomonas gessardii]